MPVQVQNPPILACYHCGADCYPIKIMEGEKAFCCEGCKTVCELLQGSGMGGYYALNEHPGTTFNGKKQSRYDFLEQDDIITHLLDYQDEDFAKVKFIAPAIHCSSCIWLLEHLYKLKPGIQKSEVNFPRKEVYISYTPQEISLREVVELMAAIGYAPELSLESLEGKKKVHRSKRSWYQLGVAGFCLGNIMLFSFPEYLGITDPTFIRLFGWLNILFSIPVVAYAAQDYFRQAFSAIRQRRINMDVPIAIGISVLFGRSVVEIITETGAGFLDSLAGLVFFLLIGKVFQQRTIDALSFDRDYKSYFPISVSRLESDKVVEIPLSEVNAGDILEIRDGELIPADAILLSGEAQLDYSFVTGESRPVSRDTGTLIYAGARQMGPAIRVQATQKVEQSYLTRLWNDKAFRKREKPAVSSLSNRAGQIFTWIILGVALVAAIFWLIYDASRAFEVITAVLIVACPCALALSTPFTLGNAIRILGKKQFFAKGVSTVEVLAQADVIVWDKTGTLTQPLEGGVHYHGPELALADEYLLSALLRHSTHPLSRRIAGTLSHQSGYEVEEFASIKGSGIQGWVNGTFVQVGSPAFTGEEPAAKAVGDGSEVAFRIGDRLRGRWILAGATRPGIPEALAKLSDHFELALLSGDNISEAEKWKGHFPAGAQMKFGQSPQDKLAFIRDLQAQGKTVVMVGDGLNDAGALAQSDCGISIAEDIAAFTPACDVILRGSELRHLPEMLAFSRGSMRVIYASFGVSILYNILGLSFAVTANLSPLVAAILMPISSISIILFATIGTNLLARGFHKPSSDSEA